MANTTELIQTLDSLMEMPPDRWRELSNEEIASLKKCLRPILAAVMKNEDPSDHPWVVNPDGGIALLRAS